MSLVPGNVNNQHDNGNAIYVLSNVTLRSFIKSVRKIEASLTK
jgi:hypothetical protein